MVGAYREVKSAKFAVQLILQIHKRAVKALNRKIRRFRCLAADVTVSLSTLTPRLSVTYEEFNHFCGALPAASYSVQWGKSHVWKVGGKVFAIGGWEKSDQAAFIIKASAINFDVLNDRPGFRPAPYLASRGMKWIQQYESSCETDEELEYYLKESHRIVSLGLTKKKQRELGFL
jgi:predicted DNA-binding protein (MmcQ/YjbR family)